MNKTDSFLEHALRERENTGSIRKLSLRKDLIDFTSNDYLGLARSKEIWENIQNEYKNYPNHSGSTGSRLLSGNSEYAEKLEGYLTEFWKSPALLFNSGYDANMGLFSSIPKKTDTIILDEYIHACIIDGARLSGARRERFIHNHLESLESKLKIATGRIFVAIESIYSMDGDEAPMIEIADLCEQYGAYLMVDEAHSTGIYGIEGRGRIEELGLSDKVFSRVFTFGKALGCHGAVVVGSSLLKEYLINFARTFIFTTALPLHSLISIFATWEHLRKNKELSQDLFRNISLFSKNLIVQEDQFKAQKGAIQVLKITGNLNARKASDWFREKGFDLRPILYPSVPPGQERLRICIHNFNKEKDIMDLTSFIEEYLHSIE